LFVQSKHSIDYVFLLTSFIFCQIYWITLLVTTGKKARTYYQQDRNIFFEEEEYNQSSPLNTLSRSSTLNSNTRTYGATVHSSDNIDALINDGEITSSAIDILEDKRDYNTIKISNTSVSTSSPIPIASSAGGSAKSLKRYKNKMKLQDSEFPLHKRTSKNVAEEDEQLNEQNNGINSTSKIYSTKADIDDDFLLSNDDSLLSNDDYGDEGLIVTSIGGGGSVRDRYFQPPKEDFLDFKASTLDVESGDENDETTAARADDSNDESMLENHEKPINFIEISSNDKKTSTSFEKPYTIRKYPSESLGYEEDEEFDFQSNYARGDGDFVGSAPVGNGRWSTLKRKKIDLDVSNQLNKNKNYNLNHLDGSKGEKISVSEINDEYGKEKNNYGPIMSPNSSLLTAAFSSELSLQNNSKTKLPEKSDEQVQSSKASDTETSSISKNRPNLSIALPPPVSPANQNIFTPKSSSPLASRTPIFASTENNEENIIQDNDDFKSNVLASKKVNNLSIAPENVNNLLTPIVEESNPLTLKGKNIEINNTNIKNINNNNVIVINKKSNHTRVPSNSLQMLFADVQNNSEKNSNNSTYENNNNNNLGINNNNKNQTIFTDSFNIAVKKFWNNEFNEAEGIFNRFKNGIPRWNVTYAEMQLVKHLMTGQSSDNESPELTNALIEAEKLAIKVCDNKDDFVRYL
jgi:hypothetical protein